MKRINNKHFAKKKKHRSLIWTILCIILVILIGGLSYGYHAYNNAKQATQKTYATGNKHKSRNVKKTIKSDKPFSILLLGTDTGALDRNDTGRTDTMIVATINPKKKTTHLTSIPRDTKVDIPGDSSQKINSAYTVGGPSQAVSSVQNLLNIPIDYYALVNMGGLEQMVNSVGGITVNPKLTFNYGKANVVKGQKQTMNGKQALDYSRMRDDDPLGDYGRQERQKEVLQKLVMKGMNFSSIPRYKSILNSLNGNLKTDMTFDNMLSIRSQYGDATHHIESDTLQGENAMIDGISYQVPTDDEISKISKSIRSNLDIGNNDQINTSKYNDNVNSSSSDNSNSNNTNSTNSTNADSTNSNNTTNSTNTSTDNGSSTSTDTNSANTLTPPTANSTPTNANDTSNNIDSSNNY